MIIGYEDYVTRDSLEHYGVPGMKWGVRKSPGERAASTRKKNAKAASRKEIRSASKLTFGEAAVSALFAGPVGVLGYKAIKISTAKQKQASRNKGGDAKAQGEAAKAKVGATVATAFLATPLTAVFYAGGKSVANQNVKAFQPKKGK